MSKKLLRWTDSLQCLFVTKSKIAERLEAAGLKTLLQLIWVLPKKTEVIPSIQSFEGLSINKMFKGRGIILSIVKRPNWKKGKSGRHGSLTNLSLRVKDILSEQVILLKWFNLYPNSSNKYVENSKIEFFGIVTEYKGIKQIISPEVRTDIEKSKNPTSFSITHYGTINGVTPSQINKLIKKIPIEIFDDLAEHLPEKIITKYNFPKISQCFKALHGLIPATTKEIESGTQRLIYQEFYLEQQEISKRKSDQLNSKGVIVHSSKEDIKNVQGIFPYKLTDDQLLCLKQISKDLRENLPMMRLLQGDVGCGKTSLAIMSSILTVNASKQVAIMCPTESLAQQHFLEFTKHISEETAKIHLLTGSTPSIERREILLNLDSGKINIIIGTHSLISDDIKFNSLALAIIDEQHKFGVEQRNKLINKSDGVNCLVMSATPIPRSLRLTQFGDLDISTIKTIPKGRKGHKTKVVMPDNFQNLLNFLKTRLSMKEQIYVVVPVIEESLTRNILNLEMIFEKFQKCFIEYKTSCLHGKMNAKDKSTALLDFKNKKTDILIATSVIEVGIDNPDATVMTIFNPECFGLSSLHQLRGRVGRGVHQGFCFLVADNNLSKTSLDRLKFLEKNSDGFEIAELDLKNRGEGDLLGVFQSGKETSKSIADIKLHENWLVKARDDLHA